MVAPLRQLALDEWRDVIAQVRLDNPGGVVLVADSLDAKYLAVFDGASTTTSPARRAA